MKEPTKGASDASPTIKELSINGSKVRWNYDEKSTNISIKDADTIEKTIVSISENYNLKIGEIATVYDNTRIDAPMYYQPVDNNGIYSSRLVINSACDFWSVSEKEQTEILSRSYLVERNVEEIAKHELAHVLTFQNCQTTQDFEEVEKKLRVDLGKICETEYGRMSNKEKGDAAEEIAECFVLLSRGEVLTYTQISLINEYIEVNRK